MKKKYYIILVLATFLFTSMAISQTSGDRANYTYNATYTKLVTGALYASYVVHLDQRAFDNASKIIVTVDGLKEDNYTTGRSVQYNFSDRLLGWDKAIEQRMVGASAEQRQSTVEQIKLNDKIEVDKSTYKVTINFGAIKVGEEQPNVTIEIEYKDLTRSAPLVEVNESML